MTQARVSWFRNRDFVFSALRALMVALGPNKPNERSFGIVLIAVFGAPLVAFLLIDGMLLSSLQSPHLFFILIYMAVAFFSNLFLFYEPMSAGHKVAEQLQDAIRPVNSTWFHLFIVLSATAIQIHNFRTAAVDITFGSPRLATWAGITTSATGWYIIFGASLLAYCGVLLCVKMFLVSQRFSAVFAFLRSPGAPGAVDGLRVLLTLNLVVFRGLLFYALYLLSWRTNGFTSTVAVSWHFEANLVLLLLLCAFGAAFTERTRRLIIQSYESAVDAALLAGGAQRPLWIARQAVRTIVTFRYLLLYALLLFVMLILMVAYARSAFFDVVLSYSNPVFSFFGLSLVPVLDLIGLASVYERLSESVIDDFRLLTQIRAPSS